MQVARVQSLAFSGGWLTYEAGCEAIDQIPANCTTTENFPSTFAGLPLK